MAKQCYNSDGHYRTGYAYSYQDSCVELHQDGAQGVHGGQRRHSGDRSTDSWIIQLKCGSTSPDDFTVTDRHFDSWDNFWIRPSKLWTSVSVPRVTSVQWMLKLYSVVMAGLGIILSLSWTCFHVYVLSVTQLPELRQQRSAISFGQTHENIDVVLLTKEKNNGKW